MALDMSAATSSGQTVTALFESSADAEKARADLLAAGFPPTEIIMSSGVAHAATVSPQVAQSVFKSLLDIFIFMPPHEQPTYEEAVRRGGVAIAVHTGPSSYERAIDILDRDGAINLDERETLWKAEGWSPDASVSRPGGPGSSEQAEFEHENQHDPLVNDTANSDVRERIGIGTSDMTAGTDIAPPSAADGVTSGMHRDLSHGRTRVRSYMGAPPMTHTGSSSAQ